MIKFLSFSSKTLSPLCALFESFIKLKIAFYQIKDGVFLQLSEFAVILLREDYNGYTDFPLSKDEEETWNKQKKKCETILENKEESLDEQSRVSIDRKYEDFIPGEGDIRKTTILHLAAQRNLTTIAEYYVKCYPKSQVTDDVPHEGRGVSAQNPIQWALLGYHDDVCSMLIKATVNQR